MRLVQKLIPELTLPLTTAPKNINPCWNSHTEFAKVKSLQLSQRSISLFVIVCLSVAIEFSRKSRM